MERIMLYRDTSCTELRVLAHLRRFVPEVSVLKYHCENYDMDARLAQQLFLAIHEQRLQAIFSVDYYPVLAEVAHTAGIPYIAWIYDAPHYALYSPTSRYDTSFLFTFDREECDRLLQMGRPHVFHQPLAADPKHFSECIAQAGEREVCDVSFLGSSYQNEHDLFARQEGLSDYEIGYLNALLCAQKQVYGYPFLGESMPGEMMDHLLSACGVEIPAAYDLPKELAAAKLLEKKLSVIERKEMVRSIADRFGITLYSETDALAGNGVRFCGLRDADGTGVFL